MSHRFDSDLPPPPVRPSLENLLIAEKYQLVRLVGQGGMGAVYEARHTTTLKRCAVKVLSATELDMNADLVRRFLREARASSVIESDHIVQIFDSGVDKATGMPYMVMELLNGEGLDVLIERAGALPPQVAIKIALQAATGLARAHEAGIVHRDIKPANLFLTRRDSGEVQVKLLDFGIAKIKLQTLSDTSGHGLTRTGSMLGTPLYMSPEQARGQTGIDARSDVWSLGMVLYELVSGELPWSGVTSLGDLMVAIITADVPPVHERAPWLPPELCQLIERAISRDAGRRFLHAGELRDALASLVPEGPRIVPELLVGLPAEQRARAAPRAPSPYGTSTQQALRTGFSRTEEALPAPKRRTGIAVALALSALGAALLVASLAVVGQRVLRDKTPAAATGELVSASAGEVPAPTVSAEALAPSAEVEAVLPEPAPSASAAQATASAVAPRPKDPPARQPAAARSEAAAKPKPSSSSKPSATKPGPGIEVDTGEF